MKECGPDRSHTALNVVRFPSRNWQVKRKKIVDINAFNGERLREPMDDGVEVF